MSERLGPRARQLAGLAGRSLGWRPAEFWRATPAELATILAPDAGATAPIDRAALSRLMEQDHD